MCLCGGGYDFLFLFLFCTSISTISYHQLAAVCLIPPGAALLAIKRAATECVTLHKRQDLRQLNIERGVIFTGSSLNEAWLSRGMMPLPGKIDSLTVALPVRVWV